MGPLILMVSNSNFVKGVMACFIENLFSMPPKLDADILLGDQGFPKLLDMTRKMNFKGNSKVVDLTQDLDRLMKLYHVWAIELFPKLRLDDFIQKTEKLCTQRRLKVVDLILDVFKRSRCPAYLGRNI